ncbi:hypothetical protein [Thermocrinis sp.]
MSVFDPLLGIAIGILYVEVLFRVLNRGTFWALITYPIRVSAFALLMAVFALKGGVIKAIALIIGFFIGLLIHTIIRGFVKVGFFKFS